MSDEDLESVDLELVSLDEADLGHPVADVLPLIALELKHLAVLRMFYDRTIASELLDKIKSRLDQRHKEETQKRKDPL